jgi:hypothetical protein
MIEVHPATVDRFEDVTTILAPKNPDAATCWCLSYRIPNQEYRALSGPERPVRLRRYAEEGTPPARQPPPPVGPPRRAAQGVGELAAWPCAPCTRTSHSHTPVPVRGRSVREADSVSVLLAAGWRTSQTT